LAAALGSFFCGAPQFLAVVDFSVVAGNLPALVFVLYEFMTRNQGSHRRREALVELIRSIPGAVRLAVVASAILLLLATVMSFGIEPRGAPVATNDGYEAINHGKVTLISQADYRRDIATFYRNIAAAAAFFVTMTGAGAVGLHRLNNRTTRN
jgi:hypothetical protein